MLNPGTIEIVKSTAPALAQVGPALTAHFYERLFNGHPELKDIFNMSHQHSGAQREALFNAICGYANNIDNLQALLPVVEKIAQKHVSFVITPDMYDIVGSNLLATIDEMLSPGQEVLDAWAEAYGVLADVFIQREEAIYQEHAQAEGGWRGTRTFKVVAKVAQSEVISSLELAPVDGAKVAPFKPGQYIGLHLAHESFANQEIRQYSLSAASNGQSYRIAVKREPQGKASNFIHDQLQVGDQVEVTAPGGDFFMEVAPDAPVCLISAGVGQTPMLAMLQTLAQGHQGPVYWLHGADHGRVHAFADEVKENGARLGRFQSRIWYRTPAQNDWPGEHFDHQGLMDLSQVQDALADPSTQFYLCGPLAFMQHVAMQLTVVGVGKGRIHYECFGPHKVI